jgi:hypothetical protein
LVGVEWSNQASEASGSTTSVAFLMQRAGAAKQGRQSLRVNPVGATGYIYQLTNDGLLLSSLKRAGERADKKGTDYERFDNVI